MPASLLAAFAVTPVAVFSALTFTFGITAPFGSVTTPVSAASAPCAKTAVLSDNRSEVVAKSLNGITDLLEILNGAAGGNGLRLAEGGRSPQGRGNLSL